ncbi:hypothetical protein TNCT_73731 [Trichonephila clavata]|uniref:Uncharacterized protein n=1 Tax=Trichonephila clavata TaxID=2740835 RepID=A0A8X6JGX6_TRICU|nr:hypothetical protein TNCT_73731 [Trichonephila clavata]
MDQNTENQHSKDSRRTEFKEISPADLIKDPRLTTKYADPCERHLNKEGLLIHVISYLTYFQQQLDYAQENPRPGNPSTHNKDPVKKLQSNIYHTNILIERIEGELASSYPCPNTDCYAYNKIPDLTHVEDGRSSGTIQTRHRPPPHKTSNSSKKKTDKEGFTSPTKTKK